MADDMTLLFTNKKNSLFGRENEFDSPTHGNESSPLEEVRVEVRFKSKIFRWYKDDFNGSATGLFEWVKDTLFPFSLRVFLTLYCEDEKIVLPDKHEWSLNLDVSTAARKAGLLKDHVTRIEPFSLEAPPNEGSPHSEGGRRRSSIFGGLKRYSYIKVNPKTAGTTQPPAAMEVMKKKLLTTYWTGDTFKEIELMEKEWIKTIEGHSNIKWMLGIGHNRKVLHPLCSIIESYAKWFEILR